MVGILAAAAAALAGRKFRRFNEGSKSKARWRFDHMVSATQGYDSIDPKYLHSAARVGRAMREALRARDGVQP